MTNMNMIEVYELNLNRKIIDEEGNELSKLPTIVYEADNFIPAKLTIFPKSADSNDIVKHLCDLLISDYRHLYYDDLDEEETKITSMRQLDINPAEIKDDTPDEEADELEGVNVKDLKNGYSAASFHGEVWVGCPYCGNTVELHGIHTRRDGYYIIKCSKCNNMYKYT